MNEHLKTILIYLGLIITIYVSFKYILPVILKFLGVVLSVVFTVAMWLAIIFIVFLIVNYLYTLYKNNG